MGTGILSVLSVGTGILSMGTNSLSMVIGCWSTVIDVLSAGMDFLSMGTSLLFVVEMTHIWQVTYLSIRMLFKATQSHEHSTSGKWFHKLQSSRMALCVFGRRLHQRDIQQKFVWTQAREMPQVGPNMRAHLVSSDSSDGIQNLKLPRLRTLQNLTRFGFPHHR